MDDQEVEGSDFLKKLKLHGKDRAWLKSKVRRSLNNTFLVPKNGSLVIPENLGIKERVQ